MSEIRVGMISSFAWLEIFTDALDAKPQFGEPLFITTAQFVPST